MNYHSHEVMPRVKELKRAGELEDALTLLEASMNYHENNREEPSSWPYSEAAIVLRKLKRYSEEVAVLERAVFRKYAARLTDKNVAKRLAKAYVLAGKAEKRKTAEGEFIYHVEDDVPIALRPAFIRHGLMVDVETTGLGTEDQIIELAMVSFSFSAVSGHIVAVEDSYSGLREPSVPISSGAAQTHGIKESQLVGEKLDAETVNGMIERSDVMVAHNASFDRRFIATEFPAVAKKPWYCTMNGIPWRHKGYESKGLQSLLEDLHIEAGQAHRGLSDATAVVSLLRHQDPETAEPFSVQLFRGDPLPNTENTKRRAQRSQGEDKIIEKLVVEINTDVLVDKLDELNDRLDAMGAPHDENADPRVGQKPSGSRRFTLLVVLLSLLTYLLILSN